MNRRARRRVRWLLLALAGTSVVVGLVSFAAPGAEARPDAPETPDAPAQAGCVERESGFGSVNDGVIVPRGVPYRLCSGPDEPANSDTCIETDWDYVVNRPRNGGSSGTTRTAKEWVCPIPGRHTTWNNNNEEYAIKNGAGCRNEVNGPLILPAFDDIAEVLVPTPGFPDYEETWKWWIDEVIAESLDARPFDEEGNRGTDPRDQENGYNFDDPGTHTNLGAKGCDLAMHPPMRSCEDINDQKMVVSQKIEELEERDAASVDNHQPELSPSEVLGQSEGDLSPSQLRAKLEEYGYAGLTKEELEQELNQLTSLGTFVPDDCWGDYPSDFYTISWEDGSWTDTSNIMERLQGWLATVAFGFGKLAVQAALWLIGLAYTFDVTEYNAEIQQLAQKYDVQLVNFGRHDAYDGGDLLGVRSFGLRHVAWFGLFAYAAFVALRGRLGRAFGEIAISIGLAILSIVVILPPDADPGEEGRITPYFNTTGYMNDTAELMDKAAVGMLLAGNARDINDDLSRAQVIDLLRNTQGTVHEEFIELPYMYLNYGKEPNEFEGDCYEVTKRILLTGYSGDGWPMRYLARNGCQEEAAFNGEMSTGRLMAAVFVTIIGTVVAILLALAALTMLLAKFLLSLLFVALPFAVVAAILPGRGRRLAWWWVGAFVQLLLAVVAMGLVLALMLLGLDAIHETTESRTLVERWVMITLLVFTVYFVRKKLISGTQAAASSLSDRLSAVNSDGRSWAGAGNGSSGGFNLMLGDRAGAEAGRRAERATIAVGALGTRVAGRAALIGMAGLLGGVGLATRSVTKRADERRVAGRAYQNLVKVAELKDELPVGTSRLTGKRGRITRRSIPNKAGRLNADRFGGLATDTSRLVRGRNNHRQLPYQWHPIHGPPWATTRRGRTWPETGSPPWPRWGGSSTRATPAPRPTARPTPRPTPRPTARPTPFRPPPPPPAFRPPPPPPPPSGGGP